MSKQQTAVEWLWGQIDGIIPYQDINTSQLFIGLLEQAKEMEKQQIIKFTNDYLDDDADTTVEQYYNETFKSE